MALALLGLMTGLAKGAASRVEKQREENESLVKTRLQLAAINKKKREAEIEARKKELSDRYSSVQPFLYENMSEEQKLALVSNPTITKDFVERRSRGEQVDVNNYLITVKDKIPTNFKSVQEYINTISAPPTAMTEEQMQGAFGRQEGILGANVGVSPGRAERIAAGLGGGSAAELLAYENMSPVESEPLSGIARINVELFPIKTEDPEEMVKRHTSNYVRLASQRGEDDPAVVAAKENLVAVQAAMSSLSGDGKKWSETESEQRQILADPASTDEERRKAQGVLARGNFNIPEVGALLKVFSTAAENALKQAYPGSNNIVYQNNPDGSVSINYLEASPQQMAAFRSITEKAVRAAAATSGYIIDGKPANGNVAAALSAVLVPGTGTGSGAVAETKPVSPTAERVQTPTQPTQAVPVRPGLGTRPTNIAEERRNAQDAIAKGAPADAVRKRFKEKTGQDL